MVDIAKDHNTALQTPASPVRPPGRRPAATAAVGDRSAAAVRYLLAGIRLALGFVFLWAFLDKAFGLGHDTTSAKAWIHGGSPTKGFLGSAAKGPFDGFYHSLAGTGFADVMFMAALLAIGVALMLGIGMRLAAGAGAVLVVHDVERRAPAGQQPVHGRPPHLRRRPRPARSARCRQHPRPRSHVDRHPAGTTQPLARLAARRRQAACEARDPPRRGLSPGRERRPGKSQPVSRSARSSVTGRVRPLACHTRRLT